MKINFSENSWNTDDITYAYSYRFEETHVFDQHSDHVVNRKISDKDYDYENVTVLTKKQYAHKTRITTRCAFEGLGAPLITIADKMFTDPRGVVRYGEYIEVVLYKNGVNVWRMWMRDGKVTWKHLLRAQFPMSEGDIHTLTIDIEEDTLKIEADEHKLQLLVDNLYTSYHLGINACEGVSRFYDLEIDGNMVEKF